LFRRIGLRTVGFDPTARSSRRRAGPKMAQARRSFPGPGPGCGLGRREVAAAAFWAGRLWTAGGLPFRPTGEMNSEKEKWPRGLCWADFALNWASFGPRTETEIRNFSFKIIRIYRELIFYYYFRCENYSVSKILLEINA